MFDAAGSVAIERDQLELAGHDRGGELRILLVQHCPNRTGSTISGLIVAEAFREIGAAVDVAFGHAGPMIAEYERRGCRTHLVPHKNWLRGGNWHQSLRRTAREVWNSRLFGPLLRDLRPHVVYVNSLVSLAAAVAARRERIPCVWHLRELFDDVGGEMRIPVIGGRALVRQLLKRLPARRIAISRSVADNLLGSRDASLVDFVPNAVNEEFFDVSNDAAACRTQLGLPEGRPIIGVAGGLRPVKGHPFLLDAAAQVARDVPECLFAIAGEGDPAYDAQLRNRTIELGIADHVRFIGTVTDMPRFHRACDIACIPSRSESFGRVAIEAFAAGTPVVATAVGGLRETIENGRTGLLVEFGDVAGLAAAITRLVSDERARAELTTNAALVAAERYSARGCRERIRSIVLPIATPRIDRDAVPAHRFLEPVSFGARQDGN